MKETSHKTSRKTFRKADTAFEFSLILGGAELASSEIENALSAAGCDDALLGSRGGVLFLDFDRVSTSLLEAVLSAIENVHSANAGLWVERVEPDDLVTAAEIARRVDRSRESIRLLIHGARGPGGFPSPIANLTKSSPIWRWSDVSTWFDRKMGAIAQSAATDASDLAAINAALELRRTLRNPSAINRLWKTGAGIALKLVARANKAPALRRDARRGKNSA